MNVVDSSAWLEFFAGGPNAGIFIVPVEDLSNLVVPSITIYEVFKVILRERGEDAAVQAVAFMKQGREVNLDSSLAIQSAKNSLDMKIPMADSIILTTARAYNAVLWTQDDDFKGISGVKYFPKP